jgi:16S rRNA (uracil1498-N3)-methyltransferase
MSEFWAHVESIEGLGPITLSADEARHVTSRRLRVGDRLTVFDGRGRLAEAHLASMARRETVVEVEMLREVPRSGAGFVLASAIPKGDRVSTLLQMTSQLGLGTWQPLILDDSVVRKLDQDAPRLQRILMESAKLARRAWALKILSPLGLEEAVTQHGGAAGSVEAFGDRLGTGNHLRREVSLILIGPEAGFSESELAWLKTQEATPVSFSPYNLRIETAAIAAVTAYHCAPNAQETENA